LAGKNAACYHCTIGPDGVIDICRSYLYTYFNPKRKTPPGLAEFFASEVVIISKLPLRQLLPTASSKLLHPPSSSLP
jgi:hypothetical protein